MPDDPKPATPAASKLPDPAPAPGQAPVAVADPAMSALLARTLMLMSTGMSQPAIAADGLDESPVEGGKFHVDGRLVNAWGVPFEGDKAPPLTPRS